MSSKKRKTKKSLSEFPPTSESAPIPSLPNDLLVSCFARVSKLYYPTLFLVSKSFRSLLTSPELHETRSLLNRTETCLFVCFRLSPNPNPCWFTLCRKPNDTKKKKKLGGYVLAPIPIPNSPQALWEKPVVAVGSNIYSIGGPINNEASNRVSVLDCRSYTWREAPSMRVERIYATANVFDGKIYVTGGCNNSNPSNWTEVFDPKTQTWGLVLSPLAERSGHCFDKSAAFEGEIYFYGKEDGSTVYNTKEDKWEVIKRYSNLDLGWQWRSYCVIENEVLYCYDKPQGIKWYDSKIRLWKNLKGVDGLVSKIAKYSCVKLVDYGGKMVVLWDKYLRCSEYEKKVIWCAVIAIEKRYNGENNSREIWGNIEWFDGLFTVPESYGFLGAVAATV